MNDEKLKTLRASYRIPEYVSDKKAAESLESSLGSALYDLNTAVRELGAELLSRLPRFIREKLRNLD